ncbi:ATP-dependent Clp protease ATP-binding subunit [candidate division WWE3 bacterium]|uniref:ATP-dependent Clp protease ATP-binding subunit n=1 Tax=candidate division WWE3 bacterium TaxID=2053526 RepID=A0A955LVW0_UNCKA|nr:ATP-dependent Clp protease ATP-binding subunit [candidate division WWE3 bacterium]
MDALKTPLVIKIIRYPLWYFVNNYYFWVKFYSRTLILLNDLLGLPATIKNLFKPYKKDATPVGFAIGIIVRTAYTIGGGIFFLAVFVAITTAVCFYYTLPINAFLLAISISDYTWVNLLGVVLFIIPFIGYLIFVVFRTPAINAEGYPTKWEKSIYERLQLKPEAAIAAKENGSFEQFLKERKLSLIDYEITKQWIAHREWEKGRWKYWQDEYFQRNVGTNLGWVSGWMRESKYFTRDLTKEAVGSRVYPWQGLDELIDRVFTILVRDQHNNVLIVGDPGVGKTSTIYAIAKRMNAVGGYSVIELNLAGLLAGSGAQGDFERRFSNTMREFKGLDMLLVIENVEQLLEAGVAQYFYPTLQNGDFPIIATTTHKKMREVLEQEGTFLNAFEKISIPEPDMPDALFILQEKVPHFEDKYGVFITYQALRGTVDMAAQYITDKAFPTKAIDLLEETCASVQSGRFEGHGENKKAIDREHIEQMVTELTGIAVGTVSESESDKLIQLEKILQQKIVGQENAVTEIASAMRRARSGLVSGDRPIGSFLFLGPTGVGKTLTAKTFAEIYFGTSERMVRMDMSEYSEYGMVERFLDRISDLVREDPFSVVLLDEFEKADRKIHNLFLQILEDGLMTDTKGNVVDFKNTIIIATSNATDPEESFSPELRNRFDGIIQYAPLSNEQVQEITKHELRDITQKLYEKEIDVSFTPGLIAAIAELGFNPEYGARPVRRAIQDHVENPLAEALLQESIEAGARLLLDWQDGCLHIQHLENQQ